MSSNLDRKMMAAVIVAFATFIGANQANAAENDFADIKGEIAKRHDASIKRLQEWIALPSIAAEDRGFPAGAEHMAKLARDAGFQQVDIIETDGKPGVFATLDAGAPKTVGLYFMYDVKQYDPAEWSSPPLESRMVDRPGEGKAIVGRGAVNQKGPQMALLAALHAFKDAGVKPPVNLVLVAEGEEEIGSTHFREIIADPEVNAALRRSVRTGRTCCYEPGPGAPKRWVERAE